MRNEECGRRRRGCSSSVVSVLPAILGVTLVLSGCASPGMRGTPYHTDTYRAKKESSGDPVNLWPLLYYRKPVLEVLWPLAECTDNYFAIRPLLSIYGTCEEKQVTSVLWPIAQFDERRNDYRIFPAFWGKKRFAVFPLYWHWRDPDGRKGVSDTMVPLWSHYRDPDGYSTHLVWPFLHFKNWNGKSGWRVWPLYGHYRSGGNGYRFYLWPFGHQRTWGDGEGEHAFFPLYYNSYGRGESMFLSLIYSQGSKDDDIGWRLMMPLFFTKRKGDDRFLATLLGGYSRKGDSLGWMAVPILSGGRKGPDSSDLWLVGPLAHSGRREDGGGSHVFPLYYYTRDGARSKFFSVPWWSGRDGDE